MTLKLPWSSRTDPPCAALARAWQRANTSPAYLRLPGVDICTHRMLVQQHASGVVMIWTSMTEALQLHPDKPPAARFHVAHQPALHCPTPLNCHTQVPPSALLPRSVQIELM